jgi:hypothetical protein
MFHAIIGTAKGIRGGGPMVSAPDFFENPFRLLSIWVNRRILRADRGFVI